MKLLHLVAGNLFGGVETLLVTLAQQRHLCPDLQSSFGLCFAGQLAEELQAAGVTPHLLGGVRLRQPWKVWQARHQLAQLLRQERFDAVVCHGAWVQVVFGPVVRQHRLPLVFWCHDTPQGTHWLERWASRVPPDLVLANSRYTQAALPRLYPGVPSHVLYAPIVNRIPTDLATTRQEVRAERNTPPEAVVLIQVSRMERCKGQGVLLEALAQLNALPGWICWIVGGPQRPQEDLYFQELRIVAGQLGLLDRVRFLGQRSDVPRLLAAADLYCQPNTGPDAFGIAFIEALYAQLPVVTTAMGGGQEIVDPSCGRLVAPNDADELSHTLADLIKQGELRSQLGAAGPQRATALCDPQRQLQQLQEVLLALVLKQQRQAPKKWLRDALQPVDFWRYLLWRKSGSAQPITVSLTDGQRLILRPAPTTDLATAYEIYVDRAYRKPALVPDVATQVIVDVGANVGYSIVYFAHLYPAAQIIAYEPHPGHVDLIHQHVKVNRLSDRVEIRPIAASNYVGDAFLREAENESSVTQESGSGHLPVQVGDLLADLAKQRIDLLKLDIEGGEYAILKDDRFADLDVRVIVLEWHNTPDVPDGYQWCRDRLTSLGFRCIEGQLRYEQAGILWGWK